MKLEFDIDKGYTNICNKKVLELDDYLNQPVIRWCHERIGPMSWPKGVNEVLCGDGWEIATDWENVIQYLDNPRIYVIIHKDIDSKLLTDFWMRFQ